MTKKISFVMLFLASYCVSMAKTWTFKECLNYAREHNISLEKAGITRKIATESKKMSKAQLLPSLDFSTNQSIGYTPWQKEGTATVTDGRVEESADNVSYNGQYSINASWTVWNGNRNRNQIRLNSLSEQKAVMDSIATAQNIEEQILQLYIQILYTKEAISVNKSTAEAARTNEERGKQMMELGQMSRADVSQLTAQRAQDEYNVVQAESQERSYIRQMKELLQITSDEPFDIVIPDLTDSMAMATIPTVGSVYGAALMQRPEIRGAQIGVESAEMQEKIARGQRMPTINMNAALSAGTNSMTSEAWGVQMKNNFRTSTSLSLSIPLFDQRNARTAINKAKLQQQDAIADLQEKKTALYSTIENYWIQAGNYQNQYRAAKASTQSAQDSYSLLSEQFAIGLKNIVELNDGKTRLLSALQSELQSKYLTILNLEMLHYYETGIMGQEN